MKPLTQLNRFFDLATEKTLSGSDQLVYLHLFNKFNRAHWTETISVRDGELLELCRLYDTNGKPSSIDAIRNARARLKKKGFIDFTSGKGNNPTEYRLMPLPPTDTPADTPADTPTDTPANSYIRVREDVKTLDILSSSSSSARGRACVNTELDEAVEYWRGGKLTAELQSKLAVYLERHDLQWVKAAMDKAILENGNSYGIAPKWLFLIMDQLENPQPLKIVKGGERRGRTVATSASDSSPAGYGHNEADTPEWAR